MWTADDVEEAQRRIARHISRTPLIDSEELSLAGTKLFIKAECLQATGSFKVRGALNALASLEPAVRSRGVVTASSGSHGKAVAYAARAFGTSATVVLPEHPVKIKRKAIEEYGASVVLQPGGWQKQLAAAKRLAKEQGLAFIHSFDAPEIFLGQGTVGLEILQDLAEIDTIVAPVGGGGLVSGILLAVKERRPKVRVVGVQPRGCAAVYESWQTGRIVEWEACDTLAEGLTCTKPEPNTLAILSRYLDDFVLVDEDEIKAALGTLLFRGKLLTEASGAAAAAAYFAGKAGAKGNVVVIASGGNVDPALVGEIAGEYGTKEARLE